MARHQESCFSFGSSPIPTVRPLFPRPWPGIANWRKDALLGAEQWRWLEQELAESTASVNIIVSSIQIFSVNPLAESWAHFPTELARLAALLKRHEQARFLLLSGDVHYAQAITLVCLSTAPRPRGDASPRTQP